MELTIEEVRTLIEASRQYFKDEGFNELDTNTAISFLTLTLLILQQSEFIPIGNPKYVTVLRALANILELQKEMLERKNEKTN